MDLNYNYSFTASVSTRSFHDKESAKAGSRGMKFHKQNLDTDFFLSLAGGGHAFCYNFENDRRLKENFQDTQILIFDIDYPKTEMNTYIQELPYKPTMAYTTYSNDPGINHYRFRLVYCFDNSITTEDEFNAFYLAVSSANGFGNSLDERKVNQLYYGSDDRLDGFQDYNSHLVYSFDDFKEYLPEPGDASVISDNAESLTRPLHISNDDNNDTLTDEDRHNYFKNYVPSLETPLDLAPTKTHFTFPDGYYAVPTRIRKGGINKWKDGEGRRQKLYKSAQIMLKNVPTLTPNNLSFNLWLLLDVYYDNTKDPITKDDIDGIVERVFERRDTDDLQPSFHKAKTRINKAFWAELGYTARQAVPMITKILHQRVMEFYDPSLSIADNYDALVAKGLPVSKRTLYRYVEELELKRDIDAEIIELMLQMPNITIKDIASALDKSVSTIKKHIKGLKEGDRPRVSRIKKQWIIEEDEQMKFYGYND